MSNAPNASNFEFLRSEWEPLPRSSRRRGKATVSGSSCAGWSGWTAKLRSALAAFLAGGTLGANQIEFLDEIINHLTEHGCIDAARLYESPHTYFSPRGVDGVFSKPQVDGLVSVLETVRQRAIA